MLTLVGAEVSNNAGPGVTTEQNSTVDLDSNNAIIGNAEEGLRLTKRAVARLGAINIFKGNGQSSITCDATSLLYGELGGIEDIACDNAEATPQTAPQPATLSTEPGVLPY